MIRNLLGYSVGYLVSDKTLCLMLYSRDLCLYQFKRMYEHTRESKKQILVSVVVRLKYLLVIPALPSSSCPKHSLI